MGSWPGAEADKWWAGLPPGRREQIHRWIQPQAAAEPVPRHQLALDVGRASSRQQQTQGAGGT